MRLECAYSFADLYWAAFGREPIPEELSELYGLPQQARNVVVADWARKAGWGTRERLGTDNVTYIAFCPIFPTETSEPSTGPNF